MAQNSSSMSFISTLYNSPARHLSRKQRYPIWHGLQLYFLKTWKSKGVETFQDLLISLEIEAMRQAIDFASRIWQEKVIIELRDRFQGQGISDVEIKKRLNHPSLKNSRIQREKIGKAGEIAARKYINELHLDCLRCSEYVSVAQILEEELNDWNFFTPLLDKPSFDINAAWQGDGGIDFRVVLAERVTLQVKTRSGGIKAVEKIDWEVSQKEVNNNDGIFCVLSLDHQIHHNFVMIGYLPTSKIRETLPQSPSYRLRADQLLFPAAIVEDFDELEGRELLNQFNPLIL